MELGLDCPVRAHPLLFLDDEIEDDETEIDAMEDDETEDDETEDPQQLQSAQEEQSDEAEVLQVADPISLQQQDTAAPSAHAILSEEMEDGIEASFPAVHPIIVDDLEDDIDALDEEHLTTAEEGLEEDMEGFFMTVHPITVDDSDSETEPPHMGELLFHHYSMWLQNENIRADKLTSSSMSDPTFMHFMGVNVQKQIVNCLKLLSLSDYLLLISKCLSRNACMMPFHLTIHLVDLVHTMQNLQDDST